MKRGCLFLLLFCSIFVPASGEEAEAWTDQTVYATAHPGYDMDTCALYSLKVLMSPAKYTCIKENEHVYSLQWKAGERKELPLPEAVKKIFSSLEKKKDVKMALPIQETPYRMYKEALNKYVFSISIFRPDVYLIFPEFGRVFAVPPVKEPEDVFHVKHSYKEKVEITHCALEARDGQIPVFFTCVNTKTNTAQPSKLGLVSLKTRELREIGQWKQYPYGEIDGSIGWLDDHRLFLFYKVRGGNCWGVFDITSKKMLAQGRSELVLESPKQGRYTDENYMENYLIRGGMLYGFMIKDRLKLLYPEKTGSPSQ